jgi:hypothetical protein
MHKAELRCIGFVPNAQSWAEVFLKGTNLPQVYLMRGIIIYINNELIRWLRQGTSFAEVYLMRGFFQDGLMDSPEIASKAVKREHTASTFGMYTHICMSAASNACQQLVTHVSS